MRSLVIDRRRFPRACETGHKLFRLAAQKQVRVAGAIAVVVCLLGMPARAYQPTAATQTVAGEAAPEAPGHPWRDMVARLVNFGLLVGSLWYLLRSPIGQYLERRGQQIRADLVHAAETKDAAAAQIAEIDRKMKALPAELEALRAQGAQEIAAEEERIRAAAAAERTRLLDQTRREINLQVKIAERELVAHAATLAVGVASERIKRTITDDDQQHLVDRYVQQLRP